MTVYDDGSTGVANVSVDLGDVRAELVLEINENDGLDAEVLAESLKSLIAGAMLSLTYHRDLVERYVYGEDV